MTLRKATTALILGPLVIVMTVGVLGIAPPAPAPNFGDPLAGLNNREIARFNEGLFQFTCPEGISDGLGPVFNNTVCSACHTDPATGGGSSTLFETRYGELLKNGVFDPLTQFGGTLIHSQGIGTISGKGTNGLVTFTFNGEIPPNQANVIAPRRVTPLFGLGLVEAVRDQDLLAIAAAQRFFAQAAGRASLILDPTPTDPTPTQVHVGRFGWKAQHALLVSFSGDAYLNEMGITTPLFPNEICPQGNCGLLDLFLTSGLPANLLAPEPNDVNLTLQQFTDFMAFLAPPPILPIPPGGNGGDQIFAAIGCAICHVPTLQSGPSPTAALNNVVFHPFSDFLLHDMGSLGDGIVQASAGATEMRTAPLWGLRNVKAFLHDGRATTIPAAILAHDGQARFARNNFAQLNPADAARLVAYLSSL